MPKVGVSLCPKKGKYSETDRKLAIAVRKGFLMSRDVEMNDYRSLSRSERRSNGVSRVS